MRNLIIFLLALALLLALPFGLKAEDTTYDTACWRLVYLDSSYKEVPGALVLRTPRLIPCDTSPQPLIGLDDYLIQSRRLRSIPDTVVVRQQATQDTIYNTACCDAVDRIWWYVDDPSTWLPCPCDPELFYFTVDTNIATIDSILYSLHAPTMEYGWGWTDKSRRGEPYMIIDTTVHRKVQILFTPDEIKKFKEMVR